MQATDLRAFDPEIHRKRKAEVDAFNGEFKESQVPASIIKEIWRRVAPSDQDLPTELRARTVRAVSEAIKAETSTPEEMATLQKLQQALEKSSSIYMGNNGFYVEMPSVTSWQILVQGQRSKHLKNCNKLEELAKLEADLLAQIQAFTKQLWEENKETLAALPALFIPPLPGSASLDTSSTTPKKRKLDLSPDTINTQDEKGNTLLPRAILEKKVYQTIRRYIKLGADSRIQNNDGDTPLHLAVRHNFTNILSMMLSTGKVDLALKNKAQKTCLDEAKDEIRTHLLKLQARPGPNGPRQIDSE